MRFLYDGIPQEPQNHRTALKTLTNYGCGRRIRTYDFLVMSQAS